MRKVNFAIVANRQQQLDALNSLDIKCPHSEHLRFPVGRRYICESNGDWTRKFQQLRLALSTKNVAKDPKAKEAGANIDESDSLVGFHNTIASIMTQLAQVEYTLENHLNPSITYVGSNENFEFVHCTIADGCTPSVGELQIVTLSRHTEKLYIVVDSCDESIELQQKLALNADLGKKS
ncbi:hypothetical protein HHI36_022551 [Cryptolaemus montrouzieri]|uniref:Uncharacterized protein n=1 Tax=Cryptolaemus montrouzieri TaxID=559131 RepID=A0ABD2N1E2_9CUCU